MMSPNENKQAGMMIWHPYQGLWNWGLMNAVKWLVPIRPLNKPIIALIILIDSGLLWMRAIWRRVSFVGFLSVLSRAKLPSDVKVLYFDLGTHKEGAELKLMTSRILPKICQNFDAYGFEASKESFDEVSSRFANQNAIHLYHLALCHEVPKEGKIRLYKDDRAGIADSIYRTSDNYEDVEAKRFSDFLRDEKIELNGKIVLLRMNIEGAEFDVIRDLCDNHLNSKFTGYYGMWDDVVKVDKNGNDDFRAFLKEHGINNFTFNGRDLTWAIRKACIEYDINTSVLRGIGNHRVS